MKVIKVIALIGFLFFNIAFNVFEEKEILASKEHISIGMVDLPEDLLYMSEDNYNTNLFLGNLFEGLVNLSSNGDVVSGLAERFTVSSDGLQYRFYLRNDGYMSNGESVTSKDFAEFFHAIVDRDKDRFYYDDLKNIKGMEEFYNGEITFDEVGIDGSKKSVLVIDLKEKDDNFLRNLTKDKFSLRGDFKYLYNYKDFYDYITYTGAYKISSVVNNQDGTTRITFNPNEYYFLNNYKTVNEKVYSIAKDKEIVIDVFPTREFALESYKNGKLNFLIDASYNSIKDYFDSDEIYYVYNESTNLILDLDQYENPEDPNIEEEASEASLSLENEMVDDEGNKVNESYVNKGNFINFILDTGDIRHINGISGSTMNSYMINKDYLRKELLKYNFDENKLIKIVTHSDDNYIDLARNLKNFLYEEFNVSSSVVALESDYIRDGLSEDEYDILISDVHKGDHFYNFDKPNLVLSNKDLNDNKIDGNGTIIINNIN